MYQNCCSPMGFHFLLILRYIARQETINVLNTHASIRASDKRYGTEKFYESFAKFIDCFKKSGYKETYLDGEKTSVTLAYDNFFDCSNTEVIWIKKEN